MSIQSTFSQQKQFICLQKPGKIVYRSLHTRTSLRRSPFALGVGQAITPITDYKDNKGQVNSRILVQKQIKTKQIKTKSIRRTKNRSPEKTEKNAVYAQLTTHFQSFQTIKNIFKI